MRIEKTVIALEPEEIMELQRILLDRDERSSFEFLRKMEKKIKILQSRCECQSDCCR